MAKIDLRLLTTIDAHESAVNWVGFGKGGKTFLSAGQDGSIKLWDSFNYEKLHTFLGHKGNISDFLFSPTKNHLLSFSEDGTVGFWNLKKGNCERFFGTQGKYPSHAAFYENGTKICISDTEGNFQFVDIKNNKIIQMFSVKGSRGHFAILDDGKCLITDRIVEGQAIWIQALDISDGKTIDETQIFPLERETEILDRLLLTPEGHHAIVGTWDFYTDDTAVYRLVNLDSHEFTTIVFPASRLVLDGLAFSKKGTKAFFPISPIIDLYRMERIPLGSKFGPLRKIGIFWNVNLNCLIAPLLSDSEIIRFALFFGRDKYLISGSERTGILSIWSSSNGRIIARSQIHKDSIMCIDVHEHHRRIVTACYDGTIGLWQY